MSDQIGFGPHALSQVINDAIGMNFFDYVNEYRLEIAKRDLKQDSSRTILQITTDVGFTSKSSFCQFFRKREGMTPTSGEKCLSSDNDNCRARGNSISLTIQWDLI